MPQPRGRKSVSDVFDRTAILRHAPFNAMSGDEADELLQIALPCQVAMNSAVFHQGDPARYFYILLEGRLKVVQVTPDGQQIVARIVGPGEMFGIARALRRTDYPATAIAVTWSAALAWPMRRWDEMISRHPSLAKAALHTLGCSLQDTQARLRELSTEDVEHRVAHTLMRLVARSGRRTAEGVLIDFPISRQDIAEMSGTTLFTVSRLLGVWATAGLVSRGRRKLVVHDTRRLKALADGKQPVAK